MWLQLVRSEATVVRCLCSLPAMSSIVNMLLRYKISSVAVAAAVALASFMYASAKSKHRQRVKGMAGKVAVITGASSGIGKALAIRLAERGFRLTLAARSAKALAEVAAAVDGTMGAPQVVPTDVTDPDACKALIAAAVAHHGGVDLLVSCAGIGHHGLCADDDIAMQRKLLDVNHFGTVHCVKAALPHLTAGNARRSGAGELLVVRAGTSGSPCCILFARKPSLTQLFNGDVRLLSTMVAARHGAARHGGVAGRLAVGRGWAADALGLLCEQVRNRRLAGGPAH